jgi:hypothetical protein
MELKDVKTILTRIKVNYPTFVNDDYTRSEWYKELKDYSLNDVMEKLEQHFRSEQYGNSIPKVYFLTKYLTKEKEKGKEIDGLLQCQLCKQFVDYKDYEDHYDRCSSIDYLDNQYFKYFKKRLEENKKQQLYLVSSDIFNEKYDKMLEYILFHTNDKEEINYINKYFEKEDLENTLD